MARKRYRLYIDESGDHTYKNMSDVSKRFLALCGCLVDSSHARETFIPTMDSIKRSHFPKHDPDEPLVFVRRKMIDKKGSFYVLRDDEARAAFDAELLGFFSEMEYAITTVVIDKQRHLSRYGDFAWHPYHYCLMAMLDRYAGLLNHFNDTGDVMVESRGKQEDKKLKNYYESIYLTGSLNRPDSFFQKALTSGQLKLEKKENNIAGLQLADMLAQPTKQDVLRRQGIISVGEIGTFNKKLLKTIQSKYNRQLYTNKIEGYGRVFMG